DMMSRVVSSALDENDDDGDGDDDSDEEDDRDDDGEGEGEGDDEDDGSTGENDEQQEELQNSFEDHGIVDVFSFKKGDKQIQVIVSRSSPLDVVLGFHSSTLHNFYCIDIDIDNPR
ncbi:hypothetical protein AAF712_013154, partial [Marasmius tenuissimus]